MPRITISFNWPWTANETRQLLSFVFQTSLATYLAFYLIEAINPGLISYTVNIHSLLWITIALGMFSAVWPFLSEDKTLPPEMSWRTWLYVSFLVLIGAYTIWTSLKDIRGSVWVIVVLAGLIIASLSLIQHYEWDESHAVKPRKNY